MMWQMLITLHLKISLLLNIYAIVPTLKSWAASIWWMIMWWFYCCIWKGNVPKLHMQLLWYLLLHWFVFLVYCGWQHASLVQQLLDSLMNQSALNMAALPISKHFIAMQTLTMISLAYFLTLVMIQLVTYLVREQMGSFHSLRSYILWQLIRMRC
jgi:hypothetical protein